jgi:hypothetical protein
MQYVEDSKHDWKVLFKGKFIPLQDGQYVRVVLQNDVAFKCIVGTVNRVDEGKGFLLAIEENAHYVKFENIETMELIVDKKQQQDEIIEVTRQFLSQREIDNGVVHEYRFVCPYCGRDMKEIAYSEFDKVYCVVCKCWIVIHDAKEFKRIG